MIESDVDDCLYLDDDNRYMQVYVHVDTCVLVRICIVYRVCYYY
jgi:hypothetical protein